MQLTPATLPEAIEWFYTVEPVPTSTGTYEDIVTDELDENGDNIIVSTEIFEDVDTLFLKQRTDLKTDAFYQRVKDTDDLKFLLYVKCKVAEREMWVFHDNYIDHMEREPKLSDETYLLPDDGVDEDKFNSDHLNWSSTFPELTTPSVEDVQNEFYTELLERRLVQLKELRKAATYKGFIYDGHKIIADRDAQNDLANIYAQYNAGIKEEGSTTNYKTDGNTYLPLVGTEGTFTLLKAMCDFVETDCFYNEATVAQKLASMSVTELLDVDLSTLFIVDHTTDRKV